MKILSTYMFLSRLAHLVLLILLVFAFGCSPSPNPGEQVFITDGLSANSFIDGYWLYLPRSYDPSKKYPVILFLQGGAGTSKDVNSVKGNGPARHAVNPKSDLYDQAGDQFIIINPHMTVGPPDKRQWFQFTKSLDAILQYVNENYAGDPSKTYITGLSKGGGGAWGVAKRLPDRFAAVVTIAGRINCNSRCEALTDIPFWIVHNTGDTQVTYEYATETVGYLKQEMGLDFLELDRVELISRELSADRIFSSLPVEGHDAWTVTYDSPSLYEWLLGKSR